MAGAWVQDETNVNDTGAAFASFAKAFSSNVTAGNLIAVAVGWGAGGQTPTVSDSLGNTYSLKTNIYDGTNNQSHGQWYAKNILGGACTITVSFSPTVPYVRLGIMEISGCDTVAPDDGAAAQIQTGGTGTDYYSSGNIVTTGTDFIFGAYQNIASFGGTVTAGATPAYILRETSVTSVLVMETRASQVAATFDANFTHTLSARSTTSVMAFKEAAAADVLRIEPSITIASRLGIGSRIISWILFLGTWVARISARIRSRPVGTTGVTRAKWAWIRTRRHAPGATSSCTGKGAYAAAMSSRTARIG